MSATQFTYLFIEVLALSTLLKLWLAHRHLAHIAAHRTAVPDAFSGQIQLSDHQKAADYTTAKTRFSTLGIQFDALLLLAFTAGGGIQWISVQCQSLFSQPIAQGMAIIVAVLLLSSLLEMPFNLYRTFRIEARFGFNKMTLRLFFADLIKQTLLGAALGLPLVFCVLWLMQWMGEQWWLYVWVTWMVFNLLVLTGQKAQVAESVVFPNPPLPPNMM